MNNSETAYFTYDGDLDFKSYPYYAPGVVDEDAVSLDLDSDSDCDTITSSTMYPTHNLNKETCPISRFPPPHIRIEVTPPTPISPASPPMSNLKSKRSLFSRLLARLRPRPYPPAQPQPATRSRSSSASSSSTASTGSSSSAGPRKSALSHGSLPSKKSVSFAPCAEVIYAPAPPRAPWASDDTLCAKEKARRRLPGLRRRPSVSERGISGPYRLGEYPSRPPRTRRQAALSIVCLG